MEKEGRDPHLGIAEEGVEELPKSLTHASVLFRSNQIENWLSITKAFLRWDDEPSISNRKRLPSLASLELNNTNTNKIKNLHVFVF